MRFQHLGRVSGHGGSSPKQTKLTQTNKYNGLPPPTPHHHPSWDLKMPLPPSSSQNTLQHLCLPSPILHWLWLNAGLKKILQKTNSPFFLFYDDNSVLTTNLNSPLHRGKMIKEPCELSRIRGKNALKKWKENKFLSPRSPSFCPSHHALLLV